MSKKPTSLQTYHLSKFHSVTSKSIKVFSSAMSCLGLLFILTMVFSNTIKANGLIEKNQYQLNYYFQNSNLNNYSLRNTYLSDTKFNNSDEQIIAKPLFSQSSEDPFAIPSDDNKKSYNANTEEYQSFVSGRDKLSSGMWRSFFLGARLSIPFLLGVEFGYDFGRWGRIRTTFDFIGFVISDSTKVELLMWNVLGDFYPFSESGFRITGSLGYNGTKVSFGSDLALFSEKGEAVRIDYPSKFAVGFGLGFDSNKDYEDEDGFYSSFDFMIYYTGNFKVSIIDSSRGDPLGGFDLPIPVLFHIGANLGWRF